MRAGPLCRQILEGRAGTDLIVRVAQEGVIFVAAAVADIQLSRREFFDGDIPLQLHHGRRRRLLPGIQGGGEQRQDLVHITHDTIVAVLEDRRVGVLVDGDDDGGVLDALQVLDRAGNAAGNVEIALELLSGHADVAVDGNVLQGLCHGAAGADGGACCLCEILDELHVLYRADALARADHALRLDDGCVGGDADGEVDALRLQFGDELVHPFLGAAFLQDHLLSGAGLAALLHCRSGSGCLVFLRGLSEDVRGDDHALHLVGALVDHGDLRVSVEALHLHALEIARAAEDLQCLVGHVAGDVGSVHLCHGGFHAVGRVGLLQLCRAVDEKTGSAELGGHIRDLERDALLLADRLAELDAFLGVFHRGLVGALGDAKSLGSNADAAAVQGGHGDLEALSFLAEQVLLRHLHVIEIQLTCGGGTDAELVIVFLKSEALPALFHDQGADAAGADAGSGHGEDHVGVRLAAVGDEDLGAVQQVVVALILRDGLRTAGVAARVRLCQAEGADLTAGTEIRQIFLLLFLRAEGCDGIGPERSVGGQDDAGAAVDSGQFLDRDGIAQDIQACAFVLRAVGDSHQPHLPEGLDLLPGELVLFVQHERDRLDLCLRECTDSGPELFMGLCGLKQHLCTSFLEKRRGNTGYFRAGD